MRLREYGATDAAYDRNSYAYYITGAASHGSGGMDGRTGGPCDKKGWESEIGLAGHMS